MVTGGDEGTILGMVIEPSPPLHHHHHHLILHFRLWKDNKLF